MTRTIHFHVGAHKTATTYMQSRLRSNKERLQQDGVDFIDLWASGVEEKAYRKRFQAIVENEVIDDRKLAPMSKQLRELVDNRRSGENSLVVISYENMLGDYDLTKGAAPYPNAMQAIRHLVDAFPEWKVRVFLSIRSMDRFIESGYVQRVVTRRETRKFKDYMNQLDLGGMSWVPAVRAIETVVGKENAIIWEYENFVADERPVWDALLARSGAESALVRPAKRSNFSLSARGLKYMRSINRVATPADAKKFRSFVRRTFGLQRGLKPPKLLDEPTRQQLISGYGHDCIDLGDIIRLYRDRDEAQRTIEPA